MVEGATLLYGPAATLVYAKACDIQDVVAGPGLVSVAVKSGEVLDEVALPRLARPMCQAGVFAQSGRIGRGVG